MSVTFFPATERRGRAEVNLCNANAAMFLTWLGYNDGPSGLVELQGEVSPKDFYNRLQAFGPEAVHMAAMYLEQQWGELRTVDGGVVTAADYIRRVIESLIGVALDAMAEQVSVVWT